MLNDARAVAIGRRRYAANLAITAAITARRSIGRMATCGFQGLMTKPSSRTNKRLKNTTHPMSSGILP
jgi:hypothetical protein